MSGCQVGDVVKFNYNGKARHGRIDNIQLQPKNGLSNLTLACSDGRRGKFKRFTLNKIQGIEVVGG